MKRLTLLLLFFGCFVGTARGQTGTIVLSATSTPAPIVVNLNCNYVVVQENSATPTNAFTITLPGQATGITYAAGTKFIFSANVGGYLKGQTIGTISIATGTVAFIGIESFITPTVPAKTGNGGGGGTPGGVSGQVQINNAGSFGGAMQVATVAIKPLVTDNVRYVTPEGNDTNDCLSLGSACATLDAALESLPGGSASAPLAAGQGEVNIVGTVPASSAASNCGFWLIGASDPNYSSPPTCFLRAPGGGGVSVRCIGPNTATPIIWTPACLENWGGQADKVHPAYWFNGSVSVSVAMHGIFDQYPSVVAKVAVDSNNARTSVSGWFNAEFDGTAGQIGAGGSNCGPGLDIGGNVNWVYIHGSTWGACQNGGGTANAEVFAISTVSRSSNVVTVVTTGTNDFAIGNSVTLQNVTDASYNSINGGTYTVTGVSGSPQTTFTFAQTGPNSSSSGGQAFGDNSAAINIDPAGQASANTIYIENENVDYGQIRYALGSTGAGISITNVASESLSTPTVTFVGLSGISQNYVENVSGADPVGSAPGIIENDAPLSPPESLVVDSPEALVAGPADVRGVLPNGAKQMTISPYREGQVGFYGGYVFGQTDISRRQFGPVAVRVANSASTSSSGWTNVGGVTITGGQTAPDGTTGAYLLTPGGAQQVFYSAAAPTLSVGDTFIFGAWTRATTSNGYPGGVPVLFTLRAGGAGAGDTCQSGTGQVNAQILYVGDTQWDWIEGTCTVTAAPTTPGAGMETVFTDSTHPMQIYAPIVLYIPNGTFSQNEVANIAANLQSYDSSCSTGAVCNLRGQVPTNVTGYQDVQEVAAPANPASGWERWYANNSLHTFSCLTSSGGSCLPGGSGSVTSVSSGNFSPLFTVSVANSTTTPAFSFSPISQNANLVFAGPSSGSAATPSFRALVEGDLPSATVFTDQNATFGAHTYDFSGVTIMKARVGAGLTSSANGDFGYDTTNKNWHFWVNGSDLFMVPLASGFVSGHCGQPTATGGSWVVADAGASCGTGSGSAPGGSTDAIQYNAGGGSFGGVNSPTVNGSYNCGFTITSSAAALPTCPQVGLINRALTGATTTDTILYSDNSGCVEHDQAATGTISETLPTATTLLNSHFVVCYANHSAQTDTITPTTWTIQKGSSAAGASISIPPAMWCRITVDPNSSTNWIADCSNIQAGTVTSVATSSPISGGTFTTSGTISCPTCVTSAASLTNNGIVIGQGGQGAATTTALPNGTTATTQSAADNSTKVATTSYVDSAVTASNPAVAVLAATTGSNLTGTYSNGVGGVGATFTITATGAFTLDGVAINTIGQRILLKDQSSAFQNGVYTATVVGTMGVSPIFTRALDYDTTSDINTTGAIPVQSGTVNAPGGQGTSWLLTSTVNTVGTDALTYIQFTYSASQVVTNTTGNASGSGEVMVSSGANKAIKDSGIAAPAAAGNATMTQTIASGTFTLGTSAIGSGSCATVVTVSASGVATTDVVAVGFNSDPTAVTGYGASATSAVLSIYPYPTANNANVKVCNSTGSSITPGSMTLNFRVTR